MTFAVWALGGLYLSLVPPALHTVFGLRQALVAGLAIGLLNATGAVAPVALGRLSAATSNLLGGAAIALGASLLMISVPTASPAVFFAGTIVAGIGFGTAFSGTLRVLTPLVSHTGRAELFASLYVVSYLAFSVPAVVAGILVEHLGLSATLVGYTAMLIALSATGTVSAIMARQRDGGQQPAPVLPSR